MPRAASKTAKAPKPKKEKAAKESHNSLRYNFGPAANHFYQGQVFVVISDETSKKYSEATNTEVKAARTNPNYRQGAEFAKRLENPIYRNEVLVLRVEKDKTYTDPVTGEPRHPVFLNITGDMNDVFKSIFFHILKLKEDLNKGVAVNRDQIVNDVQSILGSPAYTVSYAGLNNPATRPQQLAILAEYKRQAEAYKARNVFPYDIEMLNNIRVMNKTSKDIVSKEKEKKVKTKAGKTGGTTKGTKRGPQAILTKFDRHAKSGDATKLTSIVKFGQKTGRVNEKIKSVTFVQPTAVGSNTVLQTADRKWLVGGEQDIASFTRQLRAENPVGSDNHDRAELIASQLEQAWNAHISAATGAKSVSVPPHVSNILSTAQSFQNAQSGSIQYNIANLPSQSQSLGLSLGQGVPVQSQAASLNQSVGGMVPITQTSAQLSQPDFSASSQRSAPITLANLPGASAISLGSGVTPGGLSSKSTSGSGNLPLNFIQGVNQQGGLIGQGAYVPVQQSSYAPSATPGGMNSYPVAPIVQSSQQLTGVPQTSVVKSNPMQYQNLKQMPGVANAVNVSGNEFDINALLSAPL